MMMNEYLILHFAAVTFSSKFMFQSPNKKEVFMQFTDQTWASAVTIG